jgi:CheY-like chemotaxis protein
MSITSGYTSIEMAAEQLHLSKATIIQWIAAEVLLSRQTPNQVPEVFAGSIASVLEERKKLPIIDPVATDVLKVAIVEDDLDLTKLLEMTIHSFDFKTQILSVTNGFSGLALLSEYKPDVLIADLNMPIMDGFRMLKAIDHTELSPKKIIVTTALSSEDVHSRGGIPERAKLIGKPFALIELESLLRP